MRIRRENNGKDIVVTAGVEIEKPIDCETESKEVILAKLMHEYGIPLLIDMGERLFRAVQHDLKKTSKSKRYSFTLVCQDMN